MKLSNSKVITWKMFQEILNNLSKKEGKMENFLFHGCVCCLYAVLNVRIPLVRSQLCTNKLHYLLLFSLRNYCNTVAIINIMLIQNINKPIPNLPDLI